MSEQEKTENNKEDKPESIPGSIIDSENSGPEEDVSKEQGADIKIESDPLAEAEKKLELAKQETRQENERFLRLYADFENYKKRSAREIQDFRKFANDALIKELLPVLDNLERALDSSNTVCEESDKSIAQGVEMTLKEILKILEKFHVKPVEAMGKPFDPNFHEAIGQEESEEHEDNIVIKEFQKGYLLHDRLIRPAMVMVSKHKEAASEALSEISQEPVQEALIDASESESDENNKEN